MREILHYHTQLCYMLASGLWLVMDKDKYTRPELQREHERLCSEIEPAMPQCNQIISLWTEIEACFLIWAVEQ